MIKKEKYGKHEDVIFAEFGTGDIKFTKTSPLDSNDKGVSLLFHNNLTKRKIGETSNEDLGKDSDQLEKPEFVLHFKKPESITALIHSLIELQKELFDQLNA